jgi:Na+-driven multidrug efflux pump
MYGLNQEMVVFAIPSLQVIVLATLVMSLSTVLFNAVVGTGKTLINLTIEVTCVGCYLVYCFIFIEHRRSPLYICWGAEFVYWTSLLIISSLYLKSGKWKDKVI